MAVTLDESTQDARFSRLQEYLQDGWNIDPPVFVRPVWYTLHRQRDAFHFILKRDEALHLLVIPASPEVKQFVNEQAYPLNRL